MKKRSLSKYQRAGAARIDELLQENSERETMHLWYLTENADAAARDAGMKKSELFDSIYSYEFMLPKGSRCGQVGTEGNSMYSVFNPYYHGARTAIIAQVIPGPFDVAIDMGPGLRR